MGRPKKQRKTRYKTYLDPDGGDDNNFEIPESTLRYQKKPRQGEAVWEVQDFVDSPANIQHESDEESHSSGHSFVHQQHQDTERNLEQEGDNDLHGEQETRCLSNAESLPQDRMEQENDVSSCSSSTDETYENDSQSSNSQETSDEESHISDHRDDHWSNDGARNFRHYREEEAGNISISNIESPQGTSEQHNSGSSCSNSICDTSEDESQSSNSQDSSNEGGQTSNDGVDDLQNENGENQDHDNGDEVEDGDNHTEPTDPFERLKSDLEGSFRERLDLKVNISVGEILTNALLLCKKHNWSHLEKENLMKFVNAILNNGNVAPSSRYLLDELFYSTEDMWYYFYCSECSTSIGNVSPKHARPFQILCPNKDCNHVNNLSELNKASYFVTFYIPSQIELLLSNPDIRKKLVNPTDFINSPPDNIMTNMYHSDMYRSFANFVKRTIPLNIKVMPFTLSVDSASLCHFSGQKICPCFVVVNEWPYIIRMGHPILAGLWFGVIKEKIDLYMPPIVQHITKLSTSGFTLKFGAEEWSCRAYLIACCADSMGRYDLQGIHSPRGDFPCSWCLEEGEEFENSRIFRYSSPLPRLRTIKELKEDAAAALDHQTFVHGVKYMSPLAAAPMFHPVDGFIVDQMHAKDEGNTKSFLKAWLGENGITPYYVGPHMNKINERLKQVKPPKEFRKSIRDLVQLGTWTGRDLENFGQFLSVAVMESILPSRYLKHWALYVQANYILLSDELSHKAIDVAEQLIEDFCASVEELYGPRMMRFNLHILRHFAANARRWGPLFELSAYGFEAGNQKLKKLVHNANFIPSQVCRGFSEENALVLLRNYCESTNTESFRENIDRKKFSAHVEVSGKVRLVNKKSVFRPTGEEKWHISEMDKEVESFVQFGYVIKNGCHYGCNIKKKTNTDNSFAMLSDKETIIHVKKILFHEMSDEVWVVASKVRYVPSNLCPTSVIRLDPKLCFQFSVNSIDEDVDLYDVSKLHSICVSVKLRNAHYLCPMPNIFNMY